MRHLGDGFPGTLCQLCAFFDLLGRDLNQVAYLLGGCGTALGQVAHLGGHHRKTATLITRVRSLYGRVERQNIGAKCNALNGPDIGMNRQRALANFLHGFDYIRDYLTALHGRTAGTAR